MTKRWETFAAVISGRVIAGFFAAAAIAGYYYLFFLPPRQVGANDPDRYYHFGISDLMVAKHGLLRTLPQAEDLGWGQYFPDKEFLFHVLTACADWLGGPAAELMLIPLLGIGIVLLLYALLSRIVRPWQAVAIVIPIVLLTGSFLVRISMLRPHVLAVAFFCLLLFGILRRNFWLALLAACGFALGYHAFYIVVLVAAAATIFHQPGKGYRQEWIGALAGLMLGIVINPYFPSNLLMSWTHVQIALGIGVPADLDSGVELTQFGALDMLELYGIAPFGVLVALLVAWHRRLWPIREHREFWFLLLLSLILTALGMKSRRAMEYAIPCVIVLSGYSVRWMEWKWSLPTLTAALLLGQGYDTWQFYQDWWTQPQVGYSVWEFNAIAALPARPTGAKVFNCDWSDSPYLLYFRPDMRFVDVLDPALLWKASHQRYILRRALLLGRFPDPASVLRAEFHADYVLCDEPKLDTQMAADSAHFEAIPIRGGSGDLRLYRLRSPVAAGTPFDHK